MKTYKARVTKTVELTKEEYFDHLVERKDMYIRLIKDQDQRLARAKKRWSDQVDKYEAEVKSIKAQFASLK